MSQPLSFMVQTEVQLRFLGPEDLPEMKKLCSEWFPIEYPESWYEDITSSNRFYSLAATYNSVIIGIIVSEVKNKSKCNREDANILASYFPPNTSVAYILSLGVVKDFRRHGIASLLLDNLLSYLTSPEHHNCKAVYLHVLTTNTSAIQLYEHQNFHLHNFLPYYYSVRGQPRDGYCYVLYINSGQPPSTIFDYLRFIGEMLSKLRSCTFPLRFFQTAHAVSLTFVRKVLSYT